MHFFFFGTPFEGTKEEEEEEVYIYASKRGGGGRHELFPRSFSFFLAFEKESYLEKKSYKSYTYVKSPSQRSQGSLNPLNHPSPLYPLFFSKRKRKRKKETGPLGRRTLYT